MNFPNTSETHSTSNEKTSYNPPATLQHQFTGDSDYCTHSYKITQEITQTNADIVAPSFKEFGKSDREVILAGFTMEDLKVANRLGYFSTVRRSALLECGGYSPRMTWGYEDYHLWFDLFRRGKTIAIIPEILVMYRVKEKSMLHEANAHASELNAQIKKDFPFIFP